MRDRELQKLVDEAAKTKREGQQRAARVHREKAADRAPVEAALDLFLPRANGWFHASDKGFDSRVKWTREGTRVSGSLNIWVLGALHRLINQLDWVHRHAGGIARISLSKSGTVTSYSRPSAD